MRFTPDGASGGRRRAGAIGPPTGNTSRTGRHFPPVPMRISEELTIMLKCPFCGFENEDGALFCEQCKSDLSSVPSTPAPAAPAVPVAAVEAVPVAAVEAV